ncbi:D-alanine--D-alanine ligase [Nocardioides flavescens]|uniref:D-alanine--D-alanine ligase n=1 Tax=Nocardioides flavescens TaxID=2691959 RepID=A0A6L7EZC0_9ACTN|nr:D-alanine--D-alanine ligase [Nocardioides flavescens]MXG89281.1 D-alanine--D-alanine ligase [Nocardioides flavescens]
MTEASDVLKVLHLTGSAVSDDLDDLSRLYAAGCLAATADPARYEFHVVHVSPDGRWRFPADVSDGAVAAAEPVSLGAALDHVGRLDVDVVVPQMFCLPGMTAYRGLFDVLGVPYVGNPSSVMALGADKAKARAVVAAAGVDVPPGRVVRRGERVTFDVPVVVKPVDADNSLGVTLVREEGDLAPALEAAWEHSGGALVETYVELGREVRCGVLERDGELVGLPLEEYAVDTATKPVRLADDKLRRSGDGDLELVAKDVEHAWIVDPDDPVTAAVHAAARQCHVALGCRDYSLFDFRIDPSGRPWFLEASLYNSFSPKSVLATMAAAAGTGLPELFAEAVRRAAAR